MLPVLQEYRCRSALLQQQPSQNSLSTYSWFFQVGTHLPVQGNPCLRGMTLTKRVLAERIVDQSCSGTPLRRGPDLLVQRDLCQVG